MINPESIIHLGRFHFIFLHYFNYTGIPYICNVLPVWDYLWSVLTMKTGILGQTYEHLTGISWESFGLSAAGGGALVLGQDQDQRGKGFNPVESFVGSLSQLNLWDHVLTAQQVILTLQGLFSPLGADAPCHYVTERHMFPVPCHIVLPPSLSVSALPHHRSKRASLTSPT